MKLLFIALFTLSTFASLAAEKSAPDLSATITGVSAEKDKRSLTVHYEVQGHPHQSKVTFTNDIAEFRYCNWLGNYGVAIAASTLAGDFYYAPIFLTGHDGTASPVKIPAPAGQNFLVGIANTGGDSIIITAIQHRRGTLNRTLHGPDHLTGWMFIDNCPPLAAENGTGVIVPFDVSVPEKSEKK